MSIALACGGALLLAGCSSSDAATEASASSSAAPQSTQAGEAAQPSGLTGEIAYVSDGTAQVQDGSSQTAVTWTDETEITQEVEIALSDVSVGSCVTVTFADDGTTASSISVTDADDDGSCTTGFGGGMGGDMPDAMASGAPEDGAMPSGDAMPGGDGSGEELDAPEGAATAMPEASGAPGDGMSFDASSFTSGSVTAVSDSGLTVEDAEGEATEVSVGSDTTITGTEAADEDAIEVGMCMTARGESDSSGGYAATTISIFAADDDGCVTSMGMPGGSGDMPGAPGDADESEE